MQRHARTRLCAVAAAVALAAGGALALAGPAQPAAAADGSTGGLLDSAVGSVSADSTLGGLLHPAADTAGSQIRRHEQPASAAGTAGTAGTQSLNRPQTYGPLSPQGSDVSSHQKNVNWSAARASGASFTFVKATEGTDYTNPYFSRQFQGAGNAGLDHGAYHFAVPDQSSARSQADWFLAHGGAAGNDGRTLPPALDIEYNPYGATCYGMSRGAMTAWIRGFVHEVHARTGRYPVIFTSTRWWKSCTGNTTAFSRNDPLWISRWGSDPGPLPGSWANETFWQYADSGSTPGDQDRYNGTGYGLRRLSRG
jgi:GH25 family lysozyme M1 (1,4-beta-N-acetylmuramidase)